MAGRPFVLGAAFALSFLLPLVPFGSLSVRLAAEEGEYTYEVGSDGEIRYTQVLRWEPDPNVLFYDLTLQTENGEDISVTRTEESFMSLNLPPGKYRFKITVYNLLGIREFDLSWQVITVFKAEIPRVIGYKKAAWYLEDLKPEITISGKDLLPGAKVELINAAGSIPPVAGTLVDWKGTTDLWVRFPVDSIPVGEYSLLITNPGGISTTVQDALYVHLLKPVDLLFSAVYGPWFSLYDSWFTETWPGVVFPANAAGRFSLYFLKTETIYLGTELVLSGRLMKGGPVGAVIDTQIVSAGADMLVKLPFARKITAVSRFGGGIALNRFFINYRNKEGPRLAGINPFITSGLAMQYYFSRMLFAEAGVDWIHVFASGFSEGGLVPFVGAGIQF